MKVISKYGSGCSRYSTDKPTDFDKDCLGFVIKQWSRTDDGVSWDVVTLDIEAAEQLLKFLQANLNS